MSENITADRPDPAPPHIGPEVHERVDHLSDGEPVYLPYATLGHYTRDDPAASPEVDAFHGLHPWPHPYSGKPVALIELTNGALNMVAVDRLAHAPRCSACAPTWSHLEQLLEDVPDDAGISAGIPITTDHGPALLLVDAHDLPEDWFTDDEAAIPAH